MKKCNIFASAEIMIPKNIDFTKWSVIACDQFTSDPDYWKKAEELIGGAPSTLDYILPEAYLGTDFEKIKTESIKKKMESVNEEDFDIFNGFVYVRRTFEDGSVREGVVGALDLEEYDYSIDSKTKIRATEETVKSRIPARVEIRKNASYELPHIMVFVPADCDLIDTAKSLSSGSEPAYDFDLMLGGGHITGYKLSGTSADEFQSTVARFEKSRSGVIYAIGDGNHSLAAARANYCNLKEKLGKDALNHPARYALCEIVSIGSESIVFEPIYRIVTGCDTDVLLKSLDEVTSGTGKQQITVVTKDVKSEMNFTSPSSPLTVGSVQNFIDAYIKDLKGAECDYIHGKKDLIRLASREDAVGFLFDGIRKEELFDYVSEYGPYPRKTFSMGDAKSKRYYLEMRKIVK